MIVDVSFEESSQVYVVDLVSDEQTFDVDFKEDITVIPPDISGDYPLYSGIYTVTPKAKESQVLPTAKTVLLNDVTVKKVPLYQTSNTSGGNTVYIATEVF